MIDPTEETGVIGTDSLDSSMAAAPAARRPSHSRWRRHRLALGLSPTPAPGLLLVIGLAAGPAGLNLLSRDVLSYVAPAVSAALAALGVLIGLGFDVRRPHEVRLLGAASIEAGLTILLVAAGVTLAPSLQASPDVSVWLALILGICASASSTAPAADPTALDSVATHIGDLDDVLPIVLGGVVLATIRAGSPAAAAWLTVQCIVLAMAVASAAWLLVAQSSSDSEQRVFTAGSVLLLGGIAEFLSLSALLMGLVAGIFWSGVGGGTRERVARDIRYLQHPLVVLLLLVAGAGVVFGHGVAVLTLIYLVLRLAGKVGGGWVARRMVSLELPLGLGLSLISPGVIAVAFALNVGHAGADPSGKIVAIVVAGSILSEMVALIVRARETS